MRTILEIQIDRIFAFIKITLFTFCLGSVCIYINITEKIIE